MSPYEIPAKAGKPYRPSNGTEGMMFQAEWCEHCERDRHYQETMEPGTGCPIIADSLVLDASDKDYPHALTHDERGRPTCLAFKPDENGDG